MLTGGEMNRDDVTKSFKNKGYTDDDIRLLFPLLERIQEKYQNETSEGEFADQAVEEAISAFSKISESGEASPGARQPKMDMVQYKALFRVGLLFFVLIIGFLSWYFFRTDIERPQIVKDYRKGLYLPERSKGDTFKYQVRVFKNDAESEAYEEIFKVVNENKTEIEWKIERPSKGTEARMWTYLNPFMQPLKSEGYFEGDTTLVRYSGNVDSIFPLKAERGFSVEVLRDSDVFGESKYKEECKVGSQSMAATAVGDLQQIQVMCTKQKEAGQPSVYREFSYSTLIGYFVKVTEIEELGEDIIRIEKELIGVEGIKALKSRNQ